MKKLILIILMSSALFSCRNRVPDIPDVLPFVKRAMTDTTFAAYHCIEGYIPYEKDGTIAVIGDYESVYGFTEDFVSADYFDNIDAREQPDELHDYAGETVTPVFDLANTPYSGFLDAGNVPALRETAVAMAVASMDGSCYSNLYEEKARSQRRRAKILVLSSPYLCSFAYKDICSLFASKTDEPPVVSVLDQMFLSAFEDGPEAGVALLAPKEELEHGIYGNVCKRLVQDGRSLPEYLEFPLEGKDFREAFLHILDSCATAGIRLSRLMFVPPYGYDPDSLSRVIEEIYESPGIDMEVYRSVMAPDFRLTDAFAESLKEVYRIMRHENMFTHRISYPEVVPFVTVPGNDVPLDSDDYGGRMEAKFKYNHSADASVEYFRTLYLSRLYLPEDEYQNIEKLSVPVFLNVYRLTGGTR